MIQSLRLIEDADIETLVLPHGIELRRRGEAAIDEGM